MDCSYWHVLHPNIMDKFLLESFIFFCFCVPHPPAPFFLVAQIKGIHSTCCAKEVRSCALMLYMPTQQGFDVLTLHCSGWDCAVMPCRAALCHAHSLCLGQPGGCAWGHAMYASTLPLQATQSGTTEPKFLCNPAFSSIVLLQDAGWCMCLLQCSASCPVTSWKFLKSVHTQ